MNKLKKLFLLPLCISTVFLFFACNFESNSNDDSNSSGKNETLTYSPVKNIKSAANSESLILTWQNPEENYYGVKLEMSPAAGNLNSAKICSKETNTFTVTGLNSETKYTFTFTSLNNKQEETSQKAELSITTAKSPSAESSDKSDTTAPDDVTKLDCSIENLVATLSWKVSSSDDVFGYLISYKKEKIATIEASRSVLSEAMKENTVFVSPETKKYSTSVKAGSSYTFTVKTVDINGNVSNGVSTKEITIQETVGPEFSDRTEGLNYIFSTDSLADITLTITRSEWNNLLSYFDKNVKNEEYIHADFKMKKGENTWKVSDIGLRLRGNTSRKRPQKDENYYQAHFKLDFEEWLSSSGEERKLAGCMKGLNLKRFKDDPTYTREVFGYNFFRRNGIWTAPRAAYAHLFINIEEETGSTTELDYGVYAMIEEINKQYLKERTLSLQTEGSLGGGKYSDNKGDLWKCCWQKNGPSLYTDYNVSSSFGVEEIYLDESRSLRFDYDLKTNKDSLSTARNNFIDFIENLNALSTEEEIKSFYESKMDVDLFIKTYACNVLLGMDDDYWRNKNNYYFYFDTEGKAYFIPYDYDNILGTNCFTDSVVRNPLEWGEGVYKAPLIEKLLSVGDYKQKYIDYLTQLSEESSFVNDSQTEIQRLQSLVKDYINSKDLTYSDTTSSIEDDCGSWCSNRGKYKLLSGDETTNYFKAKAKSIKTYSDPKYVTLTFDLNAPSDTTNTVWLYYEEFSSTSEPYTAQNLLSGKVITTCYSSVSLSGYKFLGWYTDKTDGNLITHVPEEANSTVYAHWEKLPQYTITLDFNGGTYTSTSSSADSKTYTLYKGESLPYFTTSLDTNISNSISKDGKVFAGWYTKAEGGSMVETATATMTVYAHYTDLPYKCWAENDPGNVVTIHLKFIFDPEDFGYSANDIQSVVVASDFNDWDPDTPTMTKESDGTYTYTSSYDYDTISSNWNGYSFVVNGNKWLGWTDLTYSDYLSSEYKQYDDDGCLMIAELTIKEVNVDINDSSSIISNQ